MFQYVTPQAHEVRGRADCGAAAPENRLERPLAEPWSKVGGAQVDVGNPPQLTQRIWIVGTVTGRASNMNREGVAIEVSHQVRVYRRVGAEARLGLNEQDVRGVGHGNVDL